MISNKLQESIAECLRDRFGIKRIVLFGSYARGTADRWSDIDLLIIGTADKAERFSIMNAIREALIELKYAFDIIYLTSEEYEADKKFPGTVARYADKEGEVIYER